MEAPYDIIKDICVVLVDHEKKFLTETVDLLKSYGYKVRTVDKASEGISMLSKGKEKVDVMIINVNSPDLLSFHLLDQVVALDIVPLFICDEYDARLAKKAFKNGAYLYLEKPLNQGIVKYLWQFVLRKNLQKEKAGEGLQENRDHMNVDDFDKTNIISDNEEQHGKKNNVLMNTEEWGNNIPEPEKDISNEKCNLRRKRGRKEINEGESQNSVNKVVRRKDCTIWTVDLHAKFMEVVHQLGEGNCLPSQILEMMNVPGLTRYQVASHLQKCRNNSWRVSEEQNSTRHPSSQLGSSSCSVQRSSLTKFEMTPHLQINVTNLQHNQETPKGTEFSFPPNNNYYAIGESSNLHQVYHPQLQVDPQYLSLFDSDKNNYVGELQQQYECLFGMLESQRPNIGSAYYRHELEFNNGDHHAQNDYDLNIATYSIMPGTNIENATINGLGVANANFQQHISAPNMSHPSNIVTTTSHTHDTEGSESIEMINCDAYFNFSNMDYLFQNHEPPSFNLSNEHGSEFDQVSFDDMVVPSVQLSRITNFPDDSLT